MTKLAQHSHQLGFRHPKRDVAQGQLVGVMTATQWRLVNWGWGCITYTKKRRSACFYCIRVCATILPMRRRHICTDMSSSQQADYHQCQSTFSGSCQDCMQQARTNRPLLLQIHPLHHHGTVAAWENILPMQLGNGVASCCTVNIRDQTTALQ